MKILGKILKALCLVVLISGLAGCASGYSSKYPLCSFLASGSAGCVSDHSHS